MSAYTVEMKLSPAQVAAAFWALDSDEQAGFFAELERIAGANLCFQMAYVVKGIAERRDTDAMNGFRTMLAHAQAYFEDATDWRCTNAKIELARMERQP